MKLIKRKDGYNLIQVGTQWVVNGRGVKELFLDLEDAWDFFREIAS
jgi:hypothetical protein